MKTAASIQYSVFSVQCSEQEHVVSYNILNPVSRIQHPASSIQNPESAFTMIEIAISLAVIGFALVAIIGILPTGLDVQKQNREETIINQDASLWMEAIRNGAQGMNDLTNYVDGITNFRTLYHMDPNS